VYTINTNQRKQQQQQSSAVNVDTTAAPTCSVNALTISVSSVQQTTQLDDVAINIDNVMAVTAVIRKKVS